MLTGKWLIYESNTTLEVRTTIKIKLPHQQHGKTNSEKRKTISFFGFSLFVSFHSCIHFVYLRIIIFVFGSRFATSLIENKFTSEGLIPPLRKQQELINVFDGTCKHFISAMRRHTKFYQLTFNHFDSLRKYHRFIR